MAVVSNAQSHRQTQSLMLRNYNRATISLQTHVEVSSRRKRVCVGAGLITEQLGRPASLAGYLGKKAGYLAFLRFSCRSFNMSFLFQ